MIAALVAGIWSTASVRAQRQTRPSQPTTQKWEYRVTESASEKGLASEANSLGEQGWELTSVLASGSAVFGYFKRPKP
jgi:hypothetical protein